MLGSPFASETVVRLRGTAVADPYSGENTSTDWTTPDEEPITTLAPAEPRPSQEPVQNARNAVVDGWTLYLPTDADVTSADRMRVRGEVFEVLGTPADWLGAGLVVQCGRVEG